jgi:hypothetical protein
MKEAQSSSETSILPRATGRNIPKDTILNVMQVTTEQAVFAKLYRFNFISFDTILL